MSYTTTILSAAQATLGRDFAAADVDDHVRSRYPNLSDAQIVAHFNDTEFTTPIVRMRPCDRHVWGRGVRGNRALACQHCGRLAGQG
jgi:hypothetical protein